MFSGIVESIGIVRKIDPMGSNLDIKIHSSFGDELKIDQSIAHDGVCLTVVTLEKDTYWVTAIKETISRSNLSRIVIGSRINLERCIKFSDRLDGHVVQGHVDCTALVLDKEDQNGSTLFRLRHNGKGILVEKGSVCLNGVSLTCFDVKNSEFSVCLIPYTIENTNFRHVEIGDQINIEFDIIGKYVEQLFCKGKY